MLTDILQRLASSLQAPVIVCLIALIGVIVVILGMLIAEIFTERRQFKVSLSKLTEDLRSQPDSHDVIEQSGLLRRQKDVLHDLLDHPGITANARESLAVNYVSEEQAHFDNRIRVSDLIAKVAPMLGLMGTLIPLGPGLVSLGEGDVAKLSDSLLIAFDTTILGLVIAAFALLVSTIRRAWYKRYMSAFESATECVLEVANGKIVPAWQQVQQQGQQPLQASQQPRQTNQQYQQPQQQDRQPAQQQGEEQLQQQAQPPEQINVVTDGNSEQG